MNKKLAHAILLFFDLLSFEGLWFGYHQFQRVAMDTINKLDMIRFSNRAGFFIVAIAIPLIHLLAVVDRFWPDFQKKYNHLVNVSLVVMIVALLSAGFIGSSWIKSQVENAGYIYCREASGISALSKSLVYTKDMAVCEDLVTAKYKHRK